MELRQALAEQYHAGLAMLAQCVDKCPDDLWVQGEHPRPFWRIVWHAAYFTHNYMAQDEAAFNGSVADWPPAVRTALGAGDTQEAVDVEPYELPEGVPALTRQEMLGYIDYVRSLVDATVAGLDLSRPETGFSWHLRMPKLSHELMNLRHLQGHVGQLSERLLARGLTSAASPGPVEWGVVEPSVGCGGEGFALHEPITPTKIGSLSSLVLCEGTGGYGITL